jgi:methylase of polypeptide subunit release factors
MLGFREAADYGRAMEVLRTIEYTEAGVRRTLGREQILAMPTSDVPRLLRRTRELSPLDTCIRLFFLGLPVPEQAACAALAPLVLDTWVQAELLYPPSPQGQVAPRVQVWPVGGLLLAVDMPWRQPTAPASDFVVPPGPLTLELADTMIRRPCVRMLDLGTGSGMLALSAASHAQTVLATDKNPRAVVFTQFNARLNQINNVQGVVGDLFEPVPQQRFGQIICNPPFVISPTQRYLFRDSGERGDVFCRRLVRAAVEHLETGGFLQFTANAAQQVGRGWKADLEAWFDNLGCDVLVLVQRTEDASEYAMNWILSTETKEAALVTQRYETWMAYFEREQIEAVSYLLITVRRSGGRPTWIQIDDPPCRIAGPCGDELLTFFECRDAFGDACQTEDLLQRRPRLAPDVRIEQELAMTDGGLELCHVRLRKTGGLQYPLATHESVGRLLAGCDGSRTLHQLLEGMVEYLGVDWDRTASAVLPVVRSLLERGVLLIGNR